MDKLFTKYFNKHGLNFADAPVEGELKVVVPVYLEEDALPDLLQSLQAAAKHYAQPVELILVFNYATLADALVKERQHRLMAEVQGYFSPASGHLNIRCLTAFDIPKKHAGVGYARKVGMDYAAWSFYQQGKGKGIIASLDADCHVEPNYFSALTSAFQDTSMNACSIYFEHPLEGSCGAAVYAAIAEYELHLRYYVQALRNAGFPLAYHTVGSCFAVRSNAYVRAGGMPRKQAGEDFYFLQKVIQQGGFCDLNTTTVYPSSRPSDRVPFGTGPSVKGIVRSGEEYATYNLQAFLDLKDFLQIKDELYTLDEDQYEAFTYQLSGRIRSYLLNSDFFRALKPVKENCASLAVFKKRFYEVFNAFRVVRYLNYVHRHFVDKMPVFDAALSLYEQQRGIMLDVFDAGALLQAYRQLEKKEC
ncbi:MULTISPECIES: glycosyltransferase [unclassified Carboxylicivirga]|uniref:glycosyltransferase n=1 Tax=Carboxylicivirga TaxID=1628153 RepID=UPI003D32DAC4